MSEDKHVEWKSSWRDEYLKWLFGFANAQGGVLEVGRDNKGRIWGLDNASVKIGYFRSAAELIYHDEVHGDLFTQARHITELLLSKYMKAVVTYEDIVRIERLPVPREVLREAVLNALVHRDYMNSAPIQIRVNDDRLVLWNPAVLSEGWTQQTLLEPHASQPHNPDIANTFFRTGEIEAWGRGIERILAACREAKTPTPQIRFDAGGIWTECVFSVDYLEAVSGIPARDSADKNARPSAALVGIQPQSDLGRGGASDRQVTERCGTGQRQAGEAGPLALHRSTKRWTLGHFGGWR